MVTLKMYLDAVPYIDLRYGGVKVDVFGSDYSRPLCEHILSKHKNLRRNFFFNRYHYFLYGKEKYVEDLGTKSRYRVIDSDIKISGYFDVLYFYSVWDYYDEFTEFIRKYLDNSYRITFLLITCFECGIVGFSHVREIRNRKKYLIYNCIGDDNVHEIGRRAVFMAPRIDTIDGTIRDMAKKKNINERIFNFLGKKKVYELFVHNRFEIMDLMWIVNREVFKNELDS